MLPKTTRLTAALIKALLFVQLPAHAIAQIPMPAVQYTSLPRQVSAAHLQPPSTEFNAIDINRLAQAETPQPVVPVPPLPSALPEPFSPDGQGILGLYPEADDDIGVGHLRPANLSFFETSNSDPSGVLRGAGWLSQIAIPLYAGPDGDHWGWLIRGWLIPNGYDPIAVGRDASFVMLHTFYDVFSFPVMEIRPDGWFRFQYSSAGTVWAHTSQLGLGQLDLVVEPWENRFAEASQLYFRNVGAVYALRSEPDSDRTPISSVGSDSLIEPVEFLGDWMRVRVTQPAEGCRLLPEARTLEGWMRWRTTQQDIRIWFPPSGC
ncbi:MAG: hypothetical protein AAF215_18840 [Cyanobacteria bacterium P01_A01_bin.123]